MTLLAPWALWLSLIALPIVALYLLKIRRTRQLVPALEFWQALADTSRVRSLFDRLKRLLSMLLWLLIAACLLLAVGNPVLSVGKIRPRSIVLILDNSASMQASEGDGGHETRLAEARRTIDRITSRRPVNDDWLLIEAGRALRVAQSWTRDASLLRDAAAAIEPHLGETSLEEAVRLAEQLFTGRERPTIVVLSDGNGGELATLAQGREDLIPWPIGKATDNVGVTWLSARLHQQRAAHDVYVRVDSGSDAEVETNLVLSLDGVTTAVEPLTLAPGETWERTLTLEFPQGGVLRAAIERADALAADNEAWAILPPIRPARVLLVSRPEEAFFVQQALTAMSPVVDVQGSASIVPQRFAEAEAELLAEMKPDLVIFNNWAPPSLPEGASVCINAWPADVPARVIGVLDQPRLILEGAAHSLMSFITLRGSSVARAQRVELLDRSTVLVRSGEGDPLIFLSQQPRRETLCIAFDLLESDLPFRNGFPLLLRNAVGHMVSRQRAWVKDQYAVGEVIRPLRDLPVGIQQVSVVRMADAGEAAEEPIGVASGAFEYRGTDQIGPIRFDIGEASAYAAVNLASVAETRLAPITADDPAARLGLSGGLLGGAPWFALALFGAVLIGLEWLTYHLRWTE